MKYLKAQGKLSERNSAEQRERFMTEVLFFMQKSEVEQRLRLLEYVTTIEEFWQYRLGTSAVRVVLCLNESVKFPSQLAVRLC